MVRALPAELEVVAAAQSGLLTRQQLASAGIDAAKLRRRLESHWRLVLPGVVHLSRAPLRAEQRPVAAVLMAGPASVITGAAAAAWHGLRNGPAVARVDVLVPSGRDRRAAFVRITRTTRPPSEVHRDGVLAVTAVARAVADLCRGTRDARQARAVVIEAVQRRMTSTAKLRHELHAGARRGSAVLRLAIEAAETGAWSVPEHDLLMLIAGSSTLPTAWPNPVLHGTDGRRLPSPDVWFDEVGVAVQVHSSAYHSSGPDWDRTVRSDSALAEAGILRLAVTPREIALSPEETVRRIEAICATRSPAQRPPVVMTPRAAGVTDRVRP
ncbi:hypothetical protein [Cellulomonas alba]|uniref:Transcriptional regulator, AbiEi antitoxin, Type IV TA system n=1 Tax=Cellulomonas alba TaxID=3053467 RepID=A0ABT7SBX9_9CELL|nr:hypothetical protein [Cellulomonas alba]MDM7853688.1 hypothetical protein [Cellulomonas alba]